MRCECGAVGVRRDAARLDGRWWLVTWRTGHAPGCPGRSAPERSFLIDEAAFDAGRVALPGLPADLMARAQEFLASVAPLPPPERCAAYAYTTGERCRLPAMPNGLCGVHNRRRRHRAAAKEEL
jgi:hypothetical protein